MINNFDGIKKTTASSAREAYAVFLVIVLSWAFSTTSLAAAEPESKWVSVINLIASPERYHGKLVHVTGWATISFEDTALCLSEKPASTKECLWLEITEGPFALSEGQTTYPKAEAEWKKFHNQVITIQGAFDMRNQGHMGAFSGAIGRISKVYLVRRPRGE
jgi:hypothetical protein